MYFQKCIEANKLRKTINHVKTLELKKKCIQFR